MTEQPWVAVEEVCHMYGVTFPTAKNKIANKTFAVPTYKVGKVHVIARAVHEEFFRLKEEEGLKQLRASRSRS
ncbi:hypothetical protein [Pseudomonas citronellolis]|nr:hypothetical protein [Pseudomonas citronellolis]